MNEELEIVTPSISTIPTPREVLVSLLLTQDEAEQLKRIMDWIRGDVSAKIDHDFADDLFITLNREEEWG